MTADDRPESPETVRAARPVRAWLLGAAAALLLLLMAVPLLAPYVIDSAAVKRQLQTTVAEKTGARFDYQSLDFLFFPRPSIELHQVTLTVPGKIQGQVETLLLVPKLFPLLTGDLHLATVELTSPDVTLTLPAAEAGDTSPGPSRALLALLGPLVGATPTLKLSISDGRLVMRRDERALAEIIGLKMQMGLLVVDPATAHASLHGSFRELLLDREGRRESIKDARIIGTVKVAQGHVDFLLEHLALAEPALDLHGELVLSEQAGGNTLQLHGKGLDVTAIRRVALSLASDKPVVSAIFSYLHGGLVPKISLRSRANSPAALGALQNLLIEGQLQGGAVSIPEIPLDLTEVDGAVALANGILQATGLSARLGGSTGHDGTLKVALDQKDSDLFQMKMTLKADLAEARQILQRVVANPAFSEAMAKITDLQGHSRGVLSLGDSLSDIKARVDVTDCELSAAYQGVPLPITITQGRLSFSQRRLDVTSLSGRLGRSEFSAIAGSLAWEQTLELDLKSGTASLDLDELFPWLASQENLKGMTGEVRQLSGQLTLESAHVRGAVGLPGGWQVAAAGALRDVQIVTPRLPFPVNLVAGNFSFEPGALTFDKLQGNGLDADLVVSGQLEGFPGQARQLELALEGTLGANSAAWLRSVLDVPAVYSPRTPLNFTGTKIVWQAGAASALTGNVSIAQGPSLAFDLGYRAGQLQVNRLTVTDQHSDASLSARFDRDGEDLDFSGHLQHETLDALFVKPLPGQGEVTGEISIRVQDAAAAVVATGRLLAKNLVFPLASGKKVAMERAELDAAGDHLLVSATNLAWDSLTWQPLKATVSFKQEKVVVKIDKAMLCGIDSQGLVTISGRTLDLDLTLAGKGLDVAGSYSCLTEGRVRMTGTLDFTSRVSSRGEPQELLGKVEGPLKMTFAKGVIEQDKLLVRLLEVLNVTEIVKGRLPRLDVGGFPYTSITLQGEFKNGKLVIEKIAMDGETLDVLGHGEIDLEKQTIDVELLAAPFKTADTVIRNIPGVNYLLAGTLVSIPVSVKGSLHDPEVSVMSISSVGSSLLDLGERTLKAPLKLIETLMPGEKGRKNQQQ